MFIWRRVILQNNLDGMHDINMYYKVFYELLAIPHYRIYQNYPEDVTEYHMAQLSTKAYITLSMWLQMLTLSKRGSDNEDLGYKCSGTEGIYTNIKHNSEFFRLKANNWLIQRLNKRINHKSTHIDFLCDCASFLALLRFPYWCCTLITSVKHSRSSVKR